MFFAVVNITIFTNVRIFNFSLIQQGLYLIINMNDSNMERLVKMKKFINYLQNPYLKIFIAPLSLILFGAIMGVSHSQSPKWLAVILLYLIALTSQLTLHFLHLKFDRESSITDNPLLLRILQGLMILAAILLMIRQHWIIILLILFYLIYTHIIYYPYNISNTIYAYILAIFYESFILNIIAYYSQVGAINNDLLIHLIPIVLMFAGIYIQTFHLKDELSIYQPSKLWPRLRYLGYILSFLALALGFYLSLPSRSYFLVQILCLLVSGFALIPSLVVTKNSDQSQRKINYLSAVLSIFTIIYSLSVLF